MKIIISPAKKMQTEEALCLPFTEPVFLKEAGELLEVLKGLSYEELKKLLSCNDGIAELNFERFRTMELDRPQVHALLAYDGIQYQYMGAGVLEEESLFYLQEHLRILSGFYGVLKPLDGILPYRLEMQARLLTERGKNLYAFWGNKISEEVRKGTKTVLDLASAEYSKTVLKYLPEDVRIIRFLFGEWENGTVKEKDVYVKMARGEMVRFLAERKCTDPEEAKEFRGLGFSFSEELSAGDNWVFLREKGGEKHA